MSVGARARSARRFATPAGGLAGARLPRAARGPFPAPCAALTSPAPRPVVPRAARGIGT